MLFLILELNKFLTYNIMIFIGLACFLGGRAGMG